MLAALLLGTTALAQEFVELKVENFVVNNFTQLIDHFTPDDTRTYNQRYFVDDQFWDNKNGPVFLFICGEGRCNPPTSRGFPYQVCQSLKCLFYVLEHRFYGESQPFPDWSVDSLKYLNVTQALADMNGFITAMNADIISKFGGEARQWVTIGGSYPGAMSAWFKTSYPTAATVAWSSSGVILPIRNFVDFDEDIYTATSRSGPACPASIQAITTYIEQAITGKLTPADKELVYETFESEGIDNGDFMFYIADTFTLGVQYGGRTNLCDIFSSIAGSAMSLQLAVVKQYADKHGVTLNQYDRVALGNTKVNGQDNMRQWTWQYCTEFAWFQVPNPDHPMRSSLINADYWVPYCQSIFGAGIGEPAVDFYVKKYGGLDITGDNIVYANAIEDPWQWAGMRQIKHPLDTQKNQRAFLIDCNNCGHCVDLSTPSPADTPGLTLARQRIQAQITAWLKPAQPQQEEKLFLALE